MEVSAPNVFLAFFGVTVDVDRLEGLAGLRFPFRPRHASHICAGELVDDDELTMFPSSRRRCVCWMDYRELLCERCFLDPYHLVFFRLLLIIQTGMDTFHVCAAGLSDVVLDLVSSVQRDTNAFRLRIVNSLQRVYQFLHYQPFLTTRCIARLF